MGSAHTERLEALLTSSRAVSDADLKIVLNRLAAEVRVRLERSAESKDFFVSALVVLSKCKGSVHADTRMSCLWDCAQYFYINGQQDRAMSSALTLCSLAGLVGNAGQTIIADGGVTIA